MQTFLSLEIELSEIAPQKRNKKTFQLPGLVQKYRFWFNMFAYSHAMINPMIYITFNDNFKKAFKKVIFCSNEEIPSEHSSDFIFTWFHLEIWRKIISPFSASFQRQFSWKRTFSRRRGTDTGKNIEIRWGAAVITCNICVGNAFSWFTKSSDILKWSQKDYSGKTWVSGPVDSKPLCHSGQMSRVPKVLGSQSVSQQYQMYLKNKDLHCIVQMNIFPLSNIWMICMCVDLIGNFLFHGRTLPIYLPPPPKHINCFLFLYMPVLVIPRVSVHAVKHGEIKVFF